MSDHAIPFCTIIGLYNFLIMLKKICMDFFNCVVSQYFIQPISGRVNGAFTIETGGR